MFWLQQPLQRRNYQYGMSDMLGFPMMYSCTRGGMNTSSTVIFFKNSYFQCVTLPTTLSCTHMKPPLTNFLLTTTFQKICTTVNSRWTPTIMHFWMTCNNRTAKYFISAILRWIQRNSNFQTKSLPSSKNCWIEWLMKLIVCKYTTL